MQVLEMLGGGYSFCPGICKDLGVEMLKLVLIVKKM